MAGLCLELRECEDVCRQILVRTDLDNVDIKLSDSSTYHQLRARFPLSSKANSTLRKLASTPLSADSDINGFLGKVMSCEHMHEDVISSRPCASDGYHSDHLARHEITLLEHRVQDCNETESHPLGPPTPHGFEILMPCLPT